MSIPFTAVDLVTRKILFTGFCDVPEAIDATVFSGIRADPKFYRVRADGNWVELKPSLAVEYSAVIVAVGGTVTVTSSELVNIKVDDTVVAESVLEVDILFEEIGDYEVILEPILELHLVSSQTITVTP